MNVIIPSYKRANRLRGKDYFHMAKYCVPISQQKEYINAVGRDRVVVIPDNEDGSIAKKRNWILNNIPKPLIMIDDDVSHLVMWDHRNRKGSYLNKRVDRELLEDIFDEMVSMAQQFGVRMFGMSQSKDDRVHQEFCPFNLSRIVLGPFTGHLDHPLRYDEKVGAKDDYDMALQQLNTYKKVLRFNKFAYICDHGDNSGGIVSYRTKDKEIEWCKNIMLKWGKNIIQYRIPPKKMVDLLNAKSVNVPIKGV